MSSYLIIAVLTSLLVSSTSLASVIKANEPERIVHKISKSGLNRITNPPYTIAQVTGDEGSYKLKYDEDGQNIYLIPLLKVGEKIELSLKNNSGFVQDLELEVANISGQTIYIDGYKSPAFSSENLKSNLSLMLKAMKHNKTDKFYVQNINNKLGVIDGLELLQTKLYRWENLKGGVFLIKNNTKKNYVLDLKKLEAKFDNVLVSYIDNLTIAPKEIRRIFIIQSGV